MRLIDLTILVLQGVKQRRSRFLFTIMGIAIGIAAILFLVSMGYGLQRLLLEQITTAESLLTLDVYVPENDVVQLDKKTLEEIASWPHVEKVSPQAILPAQVTFNNLVSQASANLVRPDYFLLSGLVPDFGSELKEGQQRSVVVNSTLVQLFNLSAEAALDRELNLILFLPQVDSESGRDTV